MIGWPVARKCLVAWRLGESSQQPTWPQVRQSRKCNQGLLILRHSSQPSALGVTSRTVLRCGQARGMAEALPPPDQRVEAPWPRAGEGEIEENKTIQDRGVAAVDQREETARGV